MNERIKELAEQAGFMDSWFSESGDDCEREIKKLAEMIVKECAEIGDNYQDILEDDPECFNCRKVAYGIVDKIKQHFGVEE